MSQLERIDTRDDWDGVCAGFADAEFTQSFEWGEARRPEGWQPLRLALFDGATPIAAAQALVKERYGLQVLYCPRGPFWQRRNAAAGAAPDALWRILEIIIEDYPRAIVVCDWHADRSLVPDEGLRRRGFVPIGESLTAIIDLGQSADAMQAAFHKKWRNDLQKARQSPIEIREYQPPDHLDELYALAGRLAERKKFVLGVSHDVAARFLSLRPKETSAIFTAVNPEGVILAAALIVAFNGTASYLVGATVSKDHPAFLRGASNLVQWEALQWAKRHGHTAYNLEGLDSKGNPGVYHFKERMNGRPRPARGMWVRARNPLITAAFRILLKRLKP